MTHSRQDCTAAPLRLVGDIGATNARFGLLAAGEALPARIRSFACADFDGLEQAIRHYLAQEGGAQPTDAVLCVANPVHGERFRMTNRDWSIDLPALRAALGLARLQAINDFSALALALPELAAAELRPVGGGTALAGSALAVLGPGSGLGVSGLLPCAGNWLALGGEGGHVSMPACTAREAEVLTWIRHRHGHASAERVLSGPGLVNLHDALREIDQLPAVQRSPAQVSALAMRGECRRCAEALELFCAMLGTVAADLVLTLGARGGLFIGGGIVPRLGSFFERSSFRARFEDKGRFSGYLATVPTQVIHAPHAALRGAARAPALPCALGCTVHAPGAA